MAEDGDEDKPFCVDRAKQGRANCKKCKQKCPVGELRIAKVVPSPFGGGKMKNWHHVNCIFEQFLKQRVTTKRIESPEDVDGWDALSEEDKKEIIEKMKQCNKDLEVKHGIKISPKKLDLVPTKPAAVDDTTAKKATVKNTTNGVHRDHLFREFRRLVADISNVSSYTDKTKLVRSMFSEGSDGNGFKDDVSLWCKLLLPGVAKRIYNLQNKQLIKLFARIFNADHASMSEHLEQGDVGETVQHFFEQSRKVKPASKSMLTVKEVDKFLEELSLVTKEDDQVDHFKTILSRCTANDLKIIVRLIRHDLRMNAGAKHILQGIHADAYEVYQSSRDLDAVVNKCLGSGNKDTSGNNVVKATISLMTPVLPMLAEACKSVEQAMAKCPNGMYSEIKYDGERVQVHKKGSEFRYFSRSLKPVLPHKVAHFKDQIPKAFPHGKDLILDSEILLVDTNTGKPLPFGTLSKHKKHEFKDATVCLYVFDCIYYNGEVLTNKPIKQRKQILRENMTEIPNHVVFSEMKEIDDAEELKIMIANAIQDGLEGLVLKDTCSIYEPGKRHWLKVKKDYLFEGAMADSADLIVLGAWYGTGKKGGMMSVFLMGCYDPFSEEFRTVTKVHTGHDDKTLERLQGELEMVKISCDPGKVPGWLEVSRTMIPDFVAKNPKKQPVWEITGAEFTQHEVHTAEGISIRFPRVTKIRDDKTWKTATNLQELQKLYEESKKHTDVSLLLKNSGNNGASVPEKRKEPSTKQTCLLDFAGTKRPTSSPDLPQPKKQKTGGNIENPLPDYFENVLLLLEDGAKEIHAEWLRYFIAYGGVIVKPEECSQATHVLHVNGSVSESNIECPRTARHVTVEWIKDTVANEDLQDCLNYPVYLEPTDQPRELILKNNQRIGCGLHG